MELNRLLTMICQDDTIGGINGVGDIGMRSQEAFIKLLNLGPAQIRHAILESPIHLEAMVT